jgi:signal transduction histidine kinase
MTRRDAQLNERLQQIRRLRHDANNLLMGLMGRAELLEHGPGLDEAAREKVRRIRADCKRMQGVVEEMGRYTRDDSDD